MNKVADGSAKLAEAPCDFNEGLLKFKPKLFKFYEMKNKKMLTQRANSIMSSPEKK